MGHVGENAPNGEARTMATSLCDLSVTNFL